MKMSNALLRELMLRKDVLIIAWMILSTVVGVLFGEQGELGTWMGRVFIEPDYLLPLAVAAATVGISRWLVPSGSILRTVLLAFGATFFSFFGVFWGGQEYRQASVGCPDKGDDVRIALAKFHDQTNHYPETLDELPSPVPVCGRFLFRRSSILHYEQKGEGYRLFFLWGLGWKSEANERKSFRDEFMHP